MALSCKEYLGKNSGFIECWYFLKKKTDSLLESLPLLHSEIAAFKIKLEKYALKNTLSCPAHSGHNWNRVTHAGLYFIILHEGFSTIPVPIMNAKFTVTFLSSLSDRQILHIMQIIVAFGTREDCHAMEGAIQTTFSMIAQCPNVKFDTVTVRDIILLFILHKQAQLFKILMELGIPHELNLEQISKLVREYAHSCTVERRSFLYLWVYLARYRRFTHSEIRKTLCSVTKWMEHENNPDKKREYEVVGDAIASHFECYISEDWSSAFQEYIECIPSANAPSYAAFITELVSLFILPAQFDSLIAFIKAEKTYRIIFNYQDFCLDLNHILNVIDMIPANEPSCRILDMHILEIMLKRKKCDLMILRMLRIISRRPYYGAPCFIQVFNTLLESNCCNYIPYLLAVTQREVHNDAEQNPPMPRLDYSLYNRGHYWAIPCLFAYADRDCRIYAKLLDTSIYNLMEKSAKMLGLQNFIDIMTGSIFYVTNFALFLRICLKLNPDEYHVHLSTLANVCGNKSFRERAGEKEIYELFCVLCMEERALRYLDAFIHGADKTKQKDYMKAEIYNWLASRSSGGLKRMCCYFRCQLCGEADNACMHRRLSNRNGPFGLFISRRRSTESLLKVFRDRHEMDKIMGVRYRIALESVGSLEEPAGPVYETA